MYRHITYIAILVIFSKFLFGQCEVKKRKVNDSTYMFSMSEKFYTNVDLENGVQQFWIHINIGKDVKKNLFMGMSLVVTYVYSGSKKEFIPNKLQIDLPSGNTINLSASSKSSNTLNVIYDSPNLNTIEGIFTISPEDSKTIMKEINITRLIVKNFKTDDSFDITPKFKAQLGELISCTVNSSNDN